MRWLNARLTEIDQAIADLRDQIAGLRAAVERETETAQEQGDEPAALDDDAPSVPADPAKRLVRGSWTRSARK